ncbi:hypothetical protein LC593_10895 [Nostoc sp. CHAB 5844]|nr:hypothetical protein [Nostoc sp. CHAB 5844]
MTQINQISPETEFALVQIAQKYFSGNRFKVVSKVEKDWVEIDFSAYLCEAICDDHPHPDPCHPYYQADKFDFDVVFAPSDKTIFISSWWRNSLLTLSYSPDSCSWTEEGEDRRCPYPDGENFEAIASEMYPLLIKF